jgi:hypothetical protein
MSQVPESKTILTNAEQHTLLLESLMRYPEEFALVRGAFEFNYPFQTPVSLFERLLRQTENPSQFDRAWVEHSKALRVIGKVAAQLRRDGHEAAYYELLRALNEEDYVLAGETIRLEKTRKLVMWMPEPDKALALLRWMATTSSDQFCYTNSNRFDGSYTDPFNKENEKLLRDLDVGVPEWNSLRSGNSHGILNIIHWFLSRFLPHYHASIKHDVPLVFSGNTAPRRARNIATRYNPEDLSSIYTKDYENPLWVCRSNTNGVRCGRFAGAFAYLEEVDQGEVLRRVPRDQKHRLGTWQFHAPEVFLEGDRVRAKSYKLTTRLRIGFHPAEEHEEWQRRFPAFCSRGTSHGWGTMIVHPALDIKEYIGDEEQRKTMQRFILSTPGQVEEDYPSGTY